MSSHTEAGRAPQPPGSPFRNGRRPRPGLLGALFDPLRRSGAAPPPDAPARRRADQRPYGQRHRLGDPACRSLRPSRASPGPQRRSVRPGRADDRGRFPTGAVRGRAASAGGAASRGSGAATLLTAAGPAAAAGPVLTAPVPRPPNARPMVRGVLLGGLPAGRSQPPSREPCRSVAAGRVARRRAPGVAGHGLFRVLTLVLRGCRRARAAAEGRVSTLTAAPLPAAGSPGRDRRDPRPSSRVGGFRLPCPQSTTL